MVVLTKPRDQCGRFIPLRQRLMGDSLPVAFEFRRFRMQSNPLVAKLTTKYLLPLGTRQVGDDVVFFNFGYEEDPPMALPLEARDEPNRYCIQLYYVTASQVDLTGKKVLEVSCGAGGGASYIARTMGPASYTGLDLNPASIEKCRKSHDVPGLDFVQGDAQNLPFPDGSFDAVINVEASHQYPDFARFLAEVVRVLRPEDISCTPITAGAQAAEWWDTVLADGPAAANFATEHRGRGQTRARGKHAALARAAQSPWVAGIGPRDSLRHRPDGPGPSPRRRDFLPALLLRQGLIRRLCLGRGSASANCRARANSVTRASARVLRRDHRLGPRNTTNRHVFSQIRNHHILAALRTTGGDVGSTMSQARTRRWSSQLRRVFMLWDVVLPAV